METTLLTVTLMLLGPCIAAAQTAPCVGLGRGDQITFEDFSDLGQLMLNGQTAAIANPVPVGDTNVLRLLSTSQGGAGSAFLTSRLCLGRGDALRMAFAFEMSAPVGIGDGDGPGGDGFAFAG